MVYPLPIVICPIPTGRVKLVCGAAIHGPMIGGRWHWLRHDDGCSKEEETGGGGHAQSHGLRMRRD